MTATGTPPIPAGLTREQLLELYYFLRLTRSLEERLVNLYRQTKVIGGLFRSLGPTGTWRRRFERGASARTSTTASTSFCWNSRRSVKERTPSPIW